MASDSNVFSPSASSFLTAPSVVAVSISPPAEPDSQSSSAGGANTIVAIDSASERWTCSDYSDFTALSAVSSTTPSILSVNSSMPGTSVPTAPHSPVGEAVNDDANTNGASVDTIFGGASPYDTARTNTYSLLRFIGAQPTPSGSGSGPYSSFEFPTLNQAANVATELQASLEQEQQLYPSSSTQPNPVPRSPPMSPAQPGPGIPSFSPPATVSTNLFEESRQPSPVPSESVDGLAADLMAFSVGSSSNELPEHHPPRTVHGASSSTTTSTVRPSPLAPVAAPSTTPLTMHWPLTASPEPVNEPDSQPTMDQGSGANPAGPSIPYNATTASGGFSHTTAERWPFMGSMDHLMHVPAPHSHHPYEFIPPRPEAQFDAQHSAHEPMPIFGQLNAGTSSTAMGSERHDMGPIQQPPAYDLLTPSPLNWLPTVYAGNGERTPSCDETQLPPSNDNFNWVASCPMPKRFEPAQPRSTVFRSAASADATSLGAERILGWQNGLDFEREFGAWFSGETNPRLPYRVPSPRPITPTITVPPGSSLHRPPPFECDLFAGPPFSESSETSFDCSTDSTEEYSNSPHAFPPPHGSLPYEEGRGAVTSQDSTASNSVQSVDKGKRRLAVNTEEARQAYERAVQARKNYQPSSGFSNEHRAFDVAKAQKAYQDAIQARDRLVQRTFGSSTPAGSGTGAPRALVATPDNSSEEGSIYLASPPGPGRQQSRGVKEHTHIAASEVQSIQIVPGPGHTTVVVEQQTSAQNPATSLEPVSVLPGPGWTCAERSSINIRSMPGAGDEEKGEGWKANELLNSVKVNEEALQRDSQRHDERQRGHRGVPDTHRTSATERRSSPTPTPQGFRPPRSRPSIESLPFIPPSRTSTASSMYTGPVPAPSLHYQHPPSPSSRTSSPDTPVVQPRRRSRSFRRSSTTHTISAPAVSFVLPQATATDQTGPSYSSAAQDTTSQTWNYQSPGRMAHPGMSSGKLSTLNFNDSTRPSSWVVPPATFSTMDSVAPSVSGLNHFGTPAANPPAHDNQSWHFGPSQNAAAAPAHGPANWGSWGNTPGQQPSMGWPAWGMTPGPYPGQSPNFWSLQPQAPIMCNTMLPPSTSGTLGRNTALPHTQSTLPTYPLPTGQYNTIPGIHSQFMPPLMSLPPQSDIWGPRSAPPPYNGSPNFGWGNVPPGNGNNIQSQPTGMNGANAWGSMARYPLHPKYNFPDANVSFLVRGIEYRVHRYFFEKHSSQMKEMLASMTVPSSMPNIVPLTVDGVDFEKLLSVFYPSNPLESDLKDADDMARAIKACQQLGFQDICKSVVDLATKLPAVERILLAREHNIKELAVSGYGEMCASGKPVSTEDGEKLGAATVIRVWEVQQLLAAQDFCRSGCRKEFLESTVKQKFGLE